MSMPVKMSKITSSIIIVLIYVFAFTAVYLLFPLIGTPQTMVKVLIADVAATILVFVFSIVFNNSRVYVS